MTQYSLRYIHCKGSPSCSLVGQASGWCRGSKFQLQLPFYSCHKEFTFQSKPSWGGFPQSPPHTCTPSSSMMLPPPPPTTHHAHQPQPSPHTHHTAGPLRLPPLPVSTAYKYCNHAKPWMIPNCEVGCAYVIFETPFTNSYICRCIVTTSLAAPLFIMLNVCASGYTLLGICTIQTVDVQHWACEAPRNSPIALSHLLTLKFCMQLEAGVRSG